MLVNKILVHLDVGLIFLLTMITRGLRAEAVRVLSQAEWQYWEDHPKEWKDLSDRYDGYQWNMVRHMVEACMWGELTYHLTHNLKDTPIRNQILQLLWQKVPRLCHQLGLEHA